MATRRSDFPNQINNSLVFPGVFRGALDVRATAITFEMGIERVAAAVARSAMETGVARIQRDPEAIARDTRAFLYEGELGSL